MAGGFYSFRDNARRPGRCVTDEQSSDMKALNSLASRLAELRKKADSGDVSAMKEANDTICSISEIRVRLDGDGIRTRYDSDKRNFVVC